MQVQARAVGVRSSSILNRVQLASFQSSTKIEALREELSRMLARDPSAKAIVFSQVLALQLLHWIFELSVVRGTCLQHAGQRWRLLCRVACSLWISICGWEHPGKSDAGLGVACSSLPCWT